MTPGALRRVMVAVALVLMVLVATLALTEPAQAQDSGGELVEVDGVDALGYDEARVTVILEFSAVQAINANRWTAPAQPEVYYKRCRLCGWILAWAAGDSLSAKRFDKKPKHLLVGFAVPNLCASTSYYMRVTSNKALEDAEPHAHSIGFSFPTHDGPAIGAVTIKDKDADPSGIHVLAASETSATAVVTISDATYKEQTSFLRYRIVGDDDDGQEHAWNDPPLEGSDYREMEFELTGLIAPNYYEVQVTQEDSFQECKVVTTYLKVGSPDGPAPVVDPPDSRATSDPTPSATVAPDPSTSSDTGSGDNGNTGGTTSSGGGFGGFGGGEPVNSPPRFRESAQDMRSVPENSPEGRTVGNPILAWDPENQELTFSLRGDDPMPFTVEVVDEYTGQIVVAPEARLDYEAKDRYMVDLVVTDTGGEETVVLLEIRLTDIRLPGAADAYDVANNHNEIVEREEVEAAAEDYAAGRLTKPEMVALTKYYYATSFAPVDFSDLPTMVNKYDLNRDGVIDRLEVMSALKDYFAGQISAAELQEVVKVYFATVEPSTKQPVTTAEEE